MVLSSFQCITLVALFMTECVLIVTFNFISILLFVRCHNLRKRSMCLVLSLTIADMLVGGVSASGTITDLGKLCDMWKQGSFHYTRDNMLQSILYWLWHLFPIASITNLAAISLERVYSTFRPFAHLCITKRVYGIVAATSWITAAFVAASFAFAQRREYHYYVWNSLNVICLLVICVSYASIAVKMFCATHPQHQGGVSREKKLTKTLLLATVTSSVLWLPYTISTFLFYVTDIFASLAHSKSVLLNYVLIFVFFANSLVNPIFYTIRMPEFRRALLLLFCPRRQILRTVRQDFHLRIPRNRGNNNFDSRPPNNQEKRQARKFSEVKSKCSVSKLVNWTDELNYFLDCFMLSGLANFAVDCPCLQYEQ